MEEPSPQVIRAADGDTAAFEQLMRAYQGPIYRFLCRFLGDRDEAYDIAQETFIRLHKKIHLYSFESKFSTWLFTIARNAAVDLHRKQQRRERLFRAAPAAALRSASPASPSARRQPHLATNPKRHANHATSLWREIAGAAAEIDPTKSTRCFTPRVDPDAEPDLRNRGIVVDLNYDPVTGIAVASDALITVMNSENFTAYTNDDGVTAFGWRPPG